MSAFVISYKGRAKIMRPVQDAAEYRKLRDSIFQKKTVRRIRERIENAFASKDYMGGVGKERIRYGKNDSIFERLDLQFTLDQAMQQSVAIKGACVTRNSVKQMLKNWCKQGLIVRVEAMKYKKM